MTDSNEDQIHFLGFPLTFSQRKMKKESGVIERIVIERGREKERERVIEIERKSKLVSSSMTETHRNEPGIEGEKVRDRNINQIGQKVVTKSLIKVSVNPDPIFFLSAFSPFFLHIFPSFSIEGRIPTTVRFSIFKSIIHSSVSIYLFTFLTFILSPQSPIILSSNLGNVS